LSSTSKLQGDFWGLPKLERRAAGHIKERQFDKTACVSRETSLLSQRPGSVEKSKKPREQTNVQTSVARRAAGHIKERQFDKTACVSRETRLLSQRPGSVEKSKKPREQTNVQTSVAHRAAGHIKERQFDKTACVSIKIITKVYFYLLDPRKILEKTWKGPQNPLLTGHRLA